MAHCVICGECSEVKYFITSHHEFCSGVFVREADVSSRPRDDQRQVGDEYPVCSIDHAAETVKTMLEHRIISVEEGWFPDFRNQGMKVFVE